eukprot:350388-Chlamydomonas_euryale.AAC.13
MDSRVGLVTARLRRGWRLDGMSVDAGSSCFTTDNSSAGALRDSRSCTQRAPTPASFCVINASARTVASSAIAHEQSSSPQ